MAHDECLHDKADDLEERVVNRDSTLEATEESASAKHACELCEAHHA